MLKKHCKEVGRDYEEIEKTSLARIDSTSAAKNPKILIDTARELSKAGIDNLLIMANKDADPESYLARADTVKKIETI